MVSPANADFCFLRGFFSFSAASGHLFFLLLSPANAFLGALRGIFSFSAASGRLFFLLLSPANADFCSLRGIFSFSAASGRLFFLLLSPANADFCFLRGNLPSIGLPGNRSKAKPHLVSPVCYNHALLISCTFTAYVTYSASIRAAKRRQKHSRYEITATMAAPPRTKSLINRTRINKIQINKIRLLPHNCISKTHRLTNTATPS